MIIRRESRLEVTDEHATINELRNAVEEDTNLCLSRCGAGYTLTHKEWNRLLDLAIKGLVYEQQQKAYVNESL